MRSSACSSPSAPSSRCWRCARTDSSDDRSMRASERWRRVAWPLAAACIGIVVVPITASDFVLLQIVIKSLWLGIAGASLAFLIGQAGLISLGQTAIFGTAGYMMAILTLSHGLNIWLAVACAVASGPVAGLLVAKRAIATKGST
ncbi:MAG: hypothetical protein F4236_09735 [Acidimicrobiia bacterium]|nr:hypothetical protein [Acidimicrobiia bacterium]